MSENTHCCGEELKVKSMPFADEIYVLCEVCRTSWREGRQIPSNWPAALTEDELKTKIDHSRVSA